MRIVVNPWIGYSPLFYLKQTNVLDALNIKLIHTVSLANGKDFFISNDVEAIAATQYEYFESIKHNKQIIPVKLLDKSHGGDVIMGNVTLQQIRKAEQVSVYMEVDSINKLFFEYFLKKHNLDRRKFLFLNIDQGKISTLNKDQVSHATLMVTYTPFDVALKKNGFKVVASSKNSKLLIFDALYVTINALTKHKEQIEMLTQKIDEAVEFSKSNPVKFYNEVSPYMNNISKEEFLESIENIQWINKDVSDDIISEISSKNIPIRELK